jgi:hypothetical protein
VSARYPTVEGELEDELEGEFEDEEFLGGVARAVGGLLGQGEGESESEFEDEWEGEYEGEYEFEFEAEAEAEEEGEGFVNPVRRIYPDAELMAHLGRQASMAESEEEAEAFLGALVPLAARLIPRAAPLVRQMAPALIRGAARLGRHLRQNPTTRSLVEAVPVILQRTAQSLADQVQSGTPLSTDMVFRTLGRSTQRVIGKPASARRAISATRAFDRRRHARLRQTHGRVYPTARRQARHAGARRRASR